MLILLASTAGAETFDDDVRQLSGPDATKRQTALERISDGGQDAISALVRGLDGVEPKTRLKLIRTLVNIKREKKSLVSRDEDSVELARQARKEADRSMRANLILALKDLGGKAALRELEKFASEDPEDRIRERATYAVASMPGREIEFFRKQIKDKDRQVQLNAYEALAELGDKSGHDFALQILKGPSQVEERGTAIWTIGEIGDPNDSMVLKQIADSKTEDYTNKLLAAQATKTIELMQVPSGEQLSFLIKSLDDPSDLIRNWAGNKLWHRSDALTKSRVKLYLLEPGHKGYKEAAKALE
jgi:HEAT repeat protein